MELKIAQLNFQTGICVTKGYWQYGLLFWKYRLPRSSKKALEKTREFIRKSKVDFLALSEVDKNSSRTKRVDQAKELTKGTDLKHQVFFSAVKKKDLNMGNALCSKHPIISHQNHKLPGSGETRSLGEAVIKVKNKKVTVLITHLSLLSEVRKKQFKKISEVAEASKYPVILLGDFNEKSKKVIQDSLCKGRITAITTCLTFPSWNPSKTLDYVMIDKKFKFTSTHCPKEIKVSDHLPLVVEISERK